MNRNVDKERGRFPLNFKRNKKYIELNTTHHQNCLMTFSSIHNLDQIIIESIQTMLNQITDIN
jgi:hypothetical protein